VALAADPDLTTHRAYRLPKVELPWVRQACDEPLGDGIATDEHDWDRRRRSLGRPCCWASVRDERVHLEADEFGGKLRIQVGDAVRVPLLDDEIATLDPSELFEFLPERVEGEGFGIGEQPSDPDHASLLRQSRKRRGEESNGTGDEGSPVHY